MAEAILSPSAAEVHGCAVDEARIRDYIDLLKPRVMTLVVFTGAVGMVMAPGFLSLHPLIAFVAMVSLAFGAGAAGAINMWFDRDIDAMMTRTRLRPIPAGRISADNALSFALVMALFSVMTMGICVNWVAAFWLLFSILFYAVFYTMILKRSTDQNIVIGGAAGAFPPVIGWACVTGDVASPLPWVMMALIFFWTPPHFWALALLIKEEYAKANIPMLPVQRGNVYTARWMLGYTVLLGPLSLIPFMMGAVGYGYAIVAGVVWAGFCVAAVRVVMRPDDPARARAMFGFSILYLFALFAALMLDKVQ